MRSKIVNINGAYCFQADNKIIDALAFKSFRPTDKNVKEFYDAGVRVFHVYCSGLPSGLKVPYSLYGETWFGDHQYDFTNLDKQIDFFKRNAPEGYVFINIHLDVRDWWLKENPGNPNSFTHLSQIASNDKWQKDTADYLKALIKHVESKYNDFVIGYFLLGGYTTEWFSEFDYEQPNDYKEKAYQKYRNEISVKIPSQEILEKPKNEIILREDLEHIIPYRKFHNELVAKLVLYLCHEAQTVLNHQKLVGVFFGYILELLNERMWNAGHIEFDLINHSNDIDVLATPSSYQFRSFDGPGAYMLLCDTLNLNHKCCFISFDHTTYLVPTLPENKARLCHDSGTSLALKLLAQMRSGNKKDLLQTKEQTIQAMRREFMQKISKRVAFWWFDMFEGWFYDPDLMKEVKNEVEISHSLQNISKESNSEVAVFFSGQSLYYLNKKSEINTETICNQREGLNKMGAPYDSYSLNDLEKINLNKYKLFVFIESVYLSDNQRAIINKLKNMDKTLLFVGPADYANNGLISASKLIEMNLKENPTLENTIVFNRNSYGYTNEKSDSFIIEDKKVKTLGKYKNTNKTGFGYKIKPHSKIIYSGLGNLNYKALQIVLRLAKVHIYNTTGEAIYSCTNLIGIHSPLHKTITINLENDGVFEEIFTKKQYISHNKKIKLNTSTNCAQMLKRIN